MALIVALMVALMVHALMVALMVAYFLVQVEDLVHGLVDHFAEDLVELDKQVMIRL